MHGASHAGYYPGAIMMDIKINFSPEDGKLLGAQAVGIDGVDKRLEMMSAVIRNGGTIYDLMELEQAYAPPYSSAKDPVNMVGFVADNMLSGKVKMISWRELKDMDRSKVMLVDVRTAEEFAMGSIEGAVNISLDGSRGEYQKLPKDRTIVVFCAIGLRGYIAARVLMQHGYDVVNLNGGYRTYSTAMAEQCNPIKYSEPEPKKPVELKAPEKVVEKKSFAIDACGLQCPGPVMKLKGGMEQLKAGERLEIKVTDQGFSRDVASWAKMTGNRLVDVKEEKGIITADGTKVWLNAESRLRYPVAFNGKERRVELEGEACFEVAKDAEHPFIVCANGMNTMVLGTKFNVRSYSVEDRHVTLVNGKVQVTNTVNNKSVTLRPGQDLTYTETGEEKVSEVNIATYTAWTEGMFYFEDVPLEEIMGALGRWYNVNIDFERCELYHIRLNFWANKNTHLDEALELLNKLEKVQVDYQDGTITIKQI